MQSQEVCPCIYFLHALIYSEPSLKRKKGGGESAYLVKQNQQEKLWLPSQRLQLTHLCKSSEKKSYIFKSIQQIST